MNSVPFKYFWIALPVAIVFFGLIFLYARELDWLMNTVDVPHMLKRAALVGVILSQITAWLIARKQVELITKFQLHVGLLLVFAIFSPLFAGFLNRNLQDAPAVYETVQMDRVAVIGRNMVETIEGFEMKPDGYLLLVKMDGKIRQFRLKNNQFEGVLPGENIQLPFCRGAFGYKYLILE